MKTLKMFQAVSVLIVLSIMVGCSDQITSLEEQSINRSVKTGLTKFDVKNEEPPFYKQIKLSPKKPYTFNKGNTGLKDFSSISVTQVLPDSIDDHFYDPCHGIKVYSNSVDDLNLNCQSSNLHLKEILLLNTNSKTIVVDVLIFGTKDDNSKDEVN